VPDFRREVDTAVVDASVDTEMADFGAVRLEDDGLPAGGVGLHPRLGEGLCAARGTTCRRRDASGPNCREIRPSVHTLDEMGHT
jgi:hypothetical protein